MKVRNKINTTFKNANFAIIVVTMNKIKTQNLVIFIIDKKNADDLMLHKKICTFIIDNVSRINKNES